jgi:hypothetical protein
VNIAARKTVSVMVRKPLRNMSMSLLLGRILDVNLVLSDPKADLV